MLDGTGDAGRDVQLRRDLLARLADLIGVRVPAGVDRGARGTDGGTEGVEGFGGENIFYYLVVTFSITYLSQTVGINTTEILGLLAIAHLIHFFTVPIWGWLGDRVGRRPVYAIGVVLAAAWGFYAFRLFDTGQAWSILLALVLGLIAHGLMYAGQPAIMAEQFPTRMRYSGVSLGYQVTAIFAGSLAPIIAVRLLKDYHSSVPIAIYLAGACVVTLVALAFARETKGIDLADVDRADSERVVAS